MNSWESQSNREFYRPSSRLKEGYESDAWGEQELSRLYEDWQLSIEGQRKRLDRRY